MLAQRFGSFDRYRFDSSSQTQVDYSNRRIYNQPLSRRKYQVAHYAFGQKFDVFLLVSFNPEIVEVTVNCSFRHYSF